MNIKEIIALLTLEEKAALLQGWSTWTTWDGSKKGIPPIFLSDGPHGLRKQAGAGDHLGLNASIPATCFPTAATMANTWDPALRGSAAQCPLSHLRQCPPGQTVPPSCSRRHFLLFSALENSGRPAPLYLEFPLFHA